MDVDEKKNNVKSFENDVLSIVITKLYRLLYESIQLKLFVLKNIKSTFEKEYKSIINQLTTSLSNSDSGDHDSDAIDITILKFLCDNLNNSVTTIDDLLKLVETTLVSANKHDEFIYGSPFPQAFPKSQEWKKNEADKLNPTTEEPQLKDKQENLVRLAEDDNIDACIFEILKFKLNNSDDNYSAKVLCDYLRKSGGWHVYFGAAIYFVIKNIHSSPVVCDYIEYIRKKKENNKKGDDVDNYNNYKQYESKIIENRYSRHFLLLEILLREGTRTKLLTTETKYNYDIKNIFDFVYEGYVSRDHISDERRDSVRHKMIDLIFEYGIDVDVNQCCTRIASSHHSQGTFKWKPIHTAIKNEDGYLCELIIKHGGNIDEYEQEQSNTDGVLYRNDETLPLFSICNKRWWSGKDVQNVKLFKSILLACSKYDILPNVNLLNKYVKTKQKTRDRVLREKIVIAKRNNIKTLKLEKELETYLNDEENGKRYTHYSSSRWSDVEDSDADENTIRRRKQFHMLSVRTNYQLTCYETVIHAAVAKCNVDVIKLLLIYGCNTSMKSIKVYDSTLADIENDKSISAMFGNSNKKKEDQDLNKVLKVTYDQFLELYGKKGKNKIVLDDVESVETIYQILERANCKDNSIKIQIKNMLQSNIGWFPELFDYYPKYMQSLIKQIICSLKMTYSVPTEIVNIVIYYFYDFSDCIKFNKKNTNSQCLIQ